MLDLLHSEQHDDIMAIPIKHNANYNKNNLRSLRGISLDIIQILCARFNTAKFNIQEFGNMSRHCGVSYHGANVICWLQVSMVSPDIGL